MFRNPFDDAELAARLARLRQRIGERQLDAGVISAPENVFYLTGLDHWGYFAPHLLVVPAESEPVLVTRAMERVTIERQVRNATFRGHADTESAADIAARVLAEARPKRIGIESGAMSHGTATVLTGAVGAEWRDITGLVDELRLVKSPAEQALMRAAAEVSTAAAGAAIDAIGDGAPEREVAAACLAAMTRAGGEPPGFGPFIRPGSRLGEEHTTWGAGRLRRGEPAFLELSGCVARYHAPLGRLAHVGAIRDDDAAMAATANRAFDAVLAALRPGATAGAVYRAWQEVVDEAGLAHFRRHHCGYAVGIGCPPSWTGGNRVTGLRPDGDLVIETGMSFHVLSWLMGTGRGDFFLSDTVLVTLSGAAVLGRLPRGPFVRQ